MAPIIEESTSPPPLGKSLESNHCSDTIRAVLNSGFLSRPRKRGPCPHQREPHVAKLQTAAEHMMTQMRVQQDLGNQLSLSQLPIRDPITHADHHTVYIYIVFTGISTLAKKNCEKFEQKKKAHPVNLKSEHGIWSF